MWSPLKRILSDNCIILVKLYFDHFVKSRIMAAKVNYELMADIKCLLTSAAVLPLLEFVKALVISHNPPCLCM